MLFVLCMFSVRIISCPKTTYSSRKDDRFYFIEKPKGCKVRGRVSVYYLSFE